MPKFCKWPFEYANSAPSNSSSLCLLKLCCFVNGYERCALLKEALVNKCRVVTASYVSWD
eukprot:scaffold1786_cov181-Skeletonema_marinoi.AAC.1